MNLGSLGSVLGRVGSSMLQQHGGGLGGMIGGSGLFGLLAQNPGLLQGLLGGQLLGGQSGGRYQNHLAQPMGMYGQNMDLDVGASPMGFYGQNLNLGA